MRWPVATQWVLNLSPPFFWVLCVGLMLGSAAGFYWLWRLFARYRLIQDTPTSLVRSASQGYVELAGRAAALEGEPIIAPHLNLPCVWYRYMVKHRVDADGGGTEWKVLDRETSDGLFLLEDRTGRCVIDPEGAIASPCHKKTWRGSAPYGGGGGAHNINKMLGDYRYLVEWIAVGDPLYAMGWFNSMRAVDDFDRRDAVREKLRLWKKQPQYLQEYDANRDGEVDQQEWQAVRAAAKAEVEREFAELSVSEGHHILRKPDDRRPFLLTTKSWEQLASSYLRRAQASGLCFLLAGAAAVWLLNVRF